MRTNSSDECKTISQLDGVSWTQFVQVFFIEFKMEEDIGHDSMLGCSWILWLSWEARQLVSN